MATIKDLAYLKKSDEDDNEIRVPLENFEVLANDERVVILSKLDNDYAIVVYGLHNNSRQQLWLQEETLAMICKLLFVEGSNKVGETLNYNIPNEKYFNNLLSK